MAFILLDTGVWIALCDKRDTIIAREEIEDIYERISVHAIVLPWPILYETLGTRFVKNRLALERFEKEVKSSRMMFVDDSPYRVDAFDLSMRSSRRGRPLSLVDCLLRLLISDVNTRIQYLATFNARDFADVCASRQIEIWP